MVRNGNPTTELNYVATNHFYVEINSNIRASFSECSGLGMNIKRESYFEGGVNDQQRIVLGQVEFADVTLKRGLTNDFAFWEWISQTLSQMRQRRNVNILLFNQSGETMQCWTLLGAVPVGWKAPALQADASSVAIEELTLSYEGLKVEKSGGGAIHLSNGRDKRGYFAS
ncbi:phage tail protein [Thermocoleostomius sinensis]|uniref:Phage tail protein n=1 Tax=Thermocoleostomius sinensis A174 TaxID=2016057 RepID=A0A9E9C791_9CYAN|nr:phage tail protein [Thermocoleostomius sinensis]WAL60094.1 phage tail protein [Thermocoleostomius sinensis A174]